MSKYTKNKELAAALATDQFVTFWQKVLNALIPHLGKIGVLILVGMAAMLAVWGWSQIAGSRREKASEMLAQALRIYHADLLGEKESAPASDETPRFKTSKERADAALQALDKLQQDYPRSDAAQLGMLARAGVLYDEGRYGEADAAYRRFLDTKPKDPALLALAREGLGLCAEAQNKPEAALSIYKEHGGDFYRDRFLFSQARVLLQKGEKKQAAELYRDIVTKMPQSPLRDEAQNRLLALED